MADSLQKIPENISYKSLPNYKNVSDRVLNKALNYYTQGYIHKINIFENNETVSVTCRCWRSMRKNEEPHKVELEINIVAENIVESLCTCKVGLNGHCSHVIGLIKALRGFKFLNFKCVPAEQSCTSIPQQWHVPRTDKIKPVPLQEVVVARPAETRKRKPIKCQLDVNYKISRVSQTDKEKLMKIAGTPLELNLKSSSKVPETKTLFGEVPIGSLLSYQARTSADQSAANTISHGCGNISVNRPSIINLPTEFRDLNTGYAVENPCDLERITRTQSDCSEWYDAREKRVTASTFGEILKRKKEPNDKFLGRIFSKKKIFASSLEYGRRNEGKAKAKYLKQFPERHLHECGFVVNNEFAFLGASPDGKICDSGETGIIEIKCPYSAREMSVKEACHRITDFCLQDNENGDMSLKTNNTYYAQVQGQLLITGCSFCDFIVFTPNESDIFVQRIRPDEQFMSNMLVKLASFFKMHAMPYLNK